MSSSVGARLLGALSLVLLLVAVLGVSALAAGRFIDDDGNVHEGYIEAIAAEGITTGCNPPANDRYCPEEPVSRGQMAAFLVRALDLTDPGEGDLFTDDDDSVFEDDIDRLATAGITKGCNPPANDRYCPEEPVQRDQMASFLGRALGLDPIEPPPDPSTTSTSTSTTMVTGNLEITAINFDPPGNDNFNPNGEWVEITNQGSQDQTMGGWTLHDEGRNHTYEFPPGPPEGEWFLAVGASVRVHTGQGSEDIDTLYWGLDAAVWNNTGDTAFLRDASGALVDSQSGP